MTYSTTESGSPIQETFRKWYPIYGVERLKLEGIPSFLKECRRWVCWEAIYKGPAKKPGKKPVDVTTRLGAKSNDCATWVEFNEAVDYARANNLAGIGFQFGTLEGSDLTGLDMDNVIDEQGEMDPLAREVLKQLDSYTEISPSGRGTKTWLFSDEHPGKYENYLERNGLRMKIETCNHNHFFCMTGHALSYGEGQIQQRTEPYKALLVELGCLMDPKEPKTRTATCGETKIVRATGDLQVEADKIRAALGHLDSDPEGTYTRIGMSLKKWGHEIGNEALARLLWDEWSKTSAKYEPMEQDSRWARFGTSGVGIGTLFHDAEEEGYEYGDARSVDGKGYHIEGKSPHNEGLEAWIRGDYGPDISARRESVCETCGSSKTEAPAFRERSKPDRLPLPGIDKAVDLCEEPEDEPEQIVHGVLHRGSKMVYGGPSKAYKSWTLIDLCISVASGVPWFDFATAKGRVLYINLELQRFAIRKRIMAVCRAKGLPFPDNLDIWNLRGHARPMAELRRVLAERARTAGYSLIVPDPIYKTLLGAEENDSGDISLVCNEIERLASETGAAVAFGAHFAKGNAAAKEVIDRISGSGVFARDPDAIVTATAHQEENSYTVDMTLRNFPQPDPFVVAWEFPLMTRRGNLDPDQLKKPGGRPRGYSVEAIMAQFRDGMTVAQWHKACGDELGISRRTFYDLKKEAVAKTLVFLSSDGKTLTQNHTETITANDSSEGAGLTFDMGRSL